MTSHEQETSHAICAFMWTDTILTKLFLNNDISNFYFAHALKLLSAGIFFYKLSKIKMMDLGENYNIQ